MGRQILFHMLPVDCLAFISLVQQRDPVVLAEFTSDRAEIEPLDLKALGGHVRSWLCLWNTAVLPSMKRKYVPESNIGPYYRVDSALPILELSVPAQSSWDNKSALTQGRLYAYAYQDHLSVRTWYEALTRWPRKNFTKNPITWMSGYVGPAAHRWYEGGGLLLPYLRPPVNPEWRERIHAQHLNR